MLFYYIMIYSGIYEGGESMKMIRLLIQVPEPIKAQ